MPFTGVIFIIVIFTDPDIDTPKDELDFHFIFQRNLSLLKNMCLDFRELSRTTYGPKLYDIVVYGQSTHYTPYLDIPI